MLHACPLQRLNINAHCRDTSRTVPVISTLSCHRQRLPSLRIQAATPFDKFPPPRSSCLGQGVASTVTAQETIRTHSLLTLLYENFRRASGR